MESLASTRQLRILAERPAADAIAEVVSRLPADVQELVADRIIFIWPTGDDSCSFCLPLDADAIGDHRLVVCLHPHVAGYEVKAQAGVIVCEIARALVIPPTTDQPRAGRELRETAEQIQRLVNSWGVV